MTWTQPVCRACWNVREKGRIPVRVNNSGNDEFCCLCGRTTSEGIYMRLNPATVPFPKVEDE